MSKEVKFEGNIYVEIKENTNLTDIVPDVFNNEFDGYAKLGRVDVNGSLWPDGNDGKPYFYFRATDTTNAKFRFGNIVDLGDDILSYQKGVLHPDESADADTKIDNNYHKISENPLMYGLNSSEKKVEYVFKKDGLYVNEGDYFIAKWDTWPITIYDHNSTFLGASNIYQPSTISGSLDGKKFLGVGEYERIHIHNFQHDFTTVPFGYIVFGLYGIREDGTREMLYSSCSLNGDGRSYAAYWCEGEKPIVTNKLSLEMEWQHLPYVDDGTCTFKNAVIRFCGKEIHYQGKWGSKGFTKEPRISRHGQSQTFGTWYTGDTPYEHRVSSGLYEGMNCYDTVLKEYGFDVID